MKIDKVIMSCDTNPFYYDFWPVVSKVWKEKFDIEPILYVVGDKLPPIWNNIGKIILVPPVRDIPIYLQAQWARFHFTQKYPDDVCIISDLDILPLSHQYFVENLEEFSDDAYIHLNSGHRNVPVCYNVAKGKIFKRVLNLDAIWQYSMQALHELDLGHEQGVDFLQGKTMWGAEEEYLTQKFQSFPRDIQLVNFPMITPSNRIDRTNWNYDIDGVKKGEYYDSHLLRPYSVYKQQIDELVNLL